MQITMKVDNLAVKGKIDEQGNLHKTLVAKVTISYDPNAEEFLSGHLMEVMVADVDLRQFALGE